MDSRDEGAVVVRPKIGIDNLGGLELEGVHLPGDILVTIGRIVELTPKQQEAWAIVARGTSISEAARVLGIDRKSCRERLQYAYAKLTGGVSQEFFGRNFGLWEAYCEDVHRICKARPCVRSGNPKKYENISSQKS